jgi:hypothetical protein
MPRLFAPKREEPKVEPPPPPPPPAAGISKEEVQTMLSAALESAGERLAQTVAALTEKVEALATRQPQVVVSPSAAPATPQAPDISDADIDQAVLSGQGAAARIRALVDRAVNAATQRVIEQHVKPLQEYGVNTLSELSRRVTAGNMKYYQRFRKEIDERLNTLSPDVRANPIVIETIYNAVVGAHADELAREAAEAAIRQAQDQATGAAKTTTPGTGAGDANVKRDADAVPSLDSFLGVAAAEARDALQHKGMGGQSEDDFARSLGYKDWASYMKTYQQLLDEETRGNA